MSWSCYNCIVACMMARVATTYVVHNLNMDSELIRRNIWTVTEHFENPQSAGFGGKKVIDEESKIIDSSSAMVAFDVREEEVIDGKKLYQELN